MATSSGIRQIDARQIIKNRKKHDEVWYRNDHISVIGDSIMKRVGHIRNTMVRAYRGDRLEDLKNHVKYGNANYLKNKRIILVHAGTNDLDTTHIPEMLIDVKDLMDEIRNINARVFICISEIIPRPRDFWTTQAKILDFNHALREKEEEWGFRMIRLMHIFLHKRLPNPVLYCEDNLHPSATGYQRIAQYYSKQFSIIKKAMKIPRNKRKATLTGESRKPRGPKGYKYPGQRDRIKILFKPSGDFPAEPTYAKTDEPKEKHNPKITLPVKDKIQVQSVIVKPSNITHIPKKPVWDRLKTKSETVSQNQNQNQDTPMEKTVWERLGRKRRCTTDEASIKKRSRSRTRTRSFDERSKKAETDDRTETQKWENRYRHRESNRNREHHSRQTEHRVRHHRTDSGHTRQNRYDVRYRDYRHGNDDHKRRATYDGRYRDLRHKNDDHKRCATYDTWDDQRRYETGEHRPRHCQNRYDRDDYRRHKSEDGRHRVEARTRRDGNNYPNWGERENNCPNRGESETDKRVIDVQKNWTPRPKNKRRKNKPFQFKYDDHVMRWGTDSDRE